MFLEAGAKFLAINGHDFADVTKFIAAVVACEAQQRTLHSITEKQSINICHFWLGRKINKADNNSTLICL